jgi:glycosyltransferase involved in cell wall biosynthesis
MLNTNLPSGPVVLVDAAALGNAVIATDVNGTHDYIEHGVTG